MDKDGFEEIYSKKYCHNFLPFSIADGTFISVSTSVSSSLCRFPIGSSEVESISAALLPDEYPLIFCQEKQCGFFYIQIISYLKNIVGSSVYKHFPI